MNNLIFLANEPQITDACAGLGNFIGLAKIVVKILQIIVPIALIIWGSLDMLKAIIAGDEKKISAARKPLIQRFVSAVIVFLIPWLFNVIIGLVAQGSGTTNWTTCWRDGTATWDGSTIQTDIDDFK